MVPGTAERGQLWTCALACTALTERIRLPTTSIRADPALKVLARALRCQRPLDKGQYASISEMAAGERIERGYLGSLLRLTLLAPDIVEAILNGGVPRALTLPALLNAFPMEWSAQATVAPSRDP